MDKVTLEKWSGIGNFSLWCCQMKDYLTSKGLEQALEGTVPSNLKQEEWDVKRKKVCSIIRLHMSNEIQMELLGLTYADEIWNYLEKRYLDKSSSSRMIAKAKLYSCKMKEGQDLASHVRN